MRKGHQIQGNVKCLGSESEFSWSQNISGIWCHGHSALITILHVHLYYIAMITAWCIMMCTIACIHCSARQQNVQQYPPPPPPPPPPQAHQNVTCSCPFPASYYLECTGDCVLCHTRRSHQLHILTLSHIGLLHKKQRPLFHIQSHHHGVLERYPCVRRQ